MSKLLKKRISNLDGIERASVIEQYEIMVRNNKVLSFNKVMNERFLFPPRNDDILIPLLYNEYMIALSVFLEERKIKSRKIVNFKKYIMRKK